MQLNGSNIEVAKRRFKQTREDEINLMSDLTPEELRQLNRVLSGE